MIRSPLFNEFMTLRNSIDQFVDEATGNDSFRTLLSRSNGGNGAVAQPMPLDVYVTDEHAVIVAAVPGMHPDDVELTVQQNTVTLSGTLRSVIDTEEAKRATWYLHELGSGAYRRSVTLPFEVNADKAAASFEHGILRVTLPKSDTEKPRRISISAAGERQAIERGSS